MNSTSQNGNQTDPHDICSSTTTPPLNQYCHQFSSQPPNTPLSATAPAAVAATSSSAVTASSFPLSTLLPLILPFFPVPAESSNFKGTTFELVGSAFLCLFIFLSLLFFFFFPLFS
ncbi:hypothetical protein TorRG33x02_081880 [Trema orientale]|uniref:Transmembrane protein n=1 Tax=Trema orientale TaxID=63057 RepID=A0A2P5FDS3_TREOI|nr:hypothetical protein TorRG33x02_081880 [Trema orientale]